MANALIHYGASQYALADARNWAATHGPEGQDPMSTLTVLTLFYLVVEGVKAYANDPQRSATWRRIRERMRNVLEPETPEAAVA
jgi:hypothetical protein